MRTRLSICRKKARYQSAEEALRIAERSEVPLRPYRCDRCRKFHLTSRTKGKRVPRPHAGGDQSPLPHRNGMKAPHPSPPIP